jgi:hypothetical protein
MPPLTAACSAEAGADRVWDGEEGVSPASTARGSQEQLAGFLPSLPLLDSSASWGVVSPGSLPTGQSPFASPSAQGVAAGVAAGSCSMPAQQSLFVVHGQASFDNGAVLAEVPVIPGRSGA